MDWSFRQEICYAAIRFQLVVQKVFDAHRTRH